MMMGIPGGALQKLNGLPLDFGTSVCVASLDGSGAVSDSLTLTNLSTTQAYAFLSLSVYQDLSVEFFNSSTFDSGQAIATGTLSFDIYMDSQTADLDSQAVATGILDVLEDSAIVSQEDMDECLTSEECVEGEDSLVFIAPDTGNEAPGIELGSLTVAPSSYDLVIGTAAPVLDDGSLGAAVYFAFAHDCQVEADTNEQDGDANSGDVSSSGGDLVSESGTATIGSPAISTTGFATTIGGTL